MRGKGIRWSKTGQDGTGHMRRDIEQVILGQDGMMIGQDKMRRDNTRQRKMVKIKLNNAT